MNWLTGVTEPEQIARVDADAGGLAEAQGAAARAVGEVTVVVEAATDPTVGRGTPTAEQRPRRAPIESTANPVAAEATGPHPYS